MKSFIQMLCGPPGLILLGVILSAIGALWASQQQTKFENDLSIKNEEISALNREIVDLVVGGESFCYFMFASISSAHNTAILGINHEGDHPIYDLTARFVDLQKSKNIREQGFRDFDSIMKAETNYNIGNLSANRLSFYGAFDFGEGDKRDFNVFFSARNGFFDQLIRFRKINGEWKMATKVQRKGETIYEKIDDGFPKNELGEVAW